MKFMIKVSILGLLAGAMASMATASSFDRCKDEADVDRWKLWGSEASLTANLERCDCLMDADCVATCFQAAYGYSFECSFCFGALAICCVESGCITMGSRGETCAECNGRCVEELNQCSGLPMVSSAVEGMAELMDTPTASPVPSSPTLPPTFLCGADELGCVDEKYRVTYCIPASEGPCPCPEGMTRCPMHNWETVTSGGYCQRVCCDDGPNGTEMACPNWSPVEFDTWQVPLITYCEPLAKGCSVSQFFTFSPTTAATPIVDTNMTYAPTNFATPVAGTFKTLAPTNVITRPPTHVVSSLKEDTPAASPGSSSSPQEETPTASPVPTSSSHPQAQTGSSAPKATLIVAAVSMTGIWVTLLYLV